MKNTNAFWGSNTRQGLICFSIKGKVKSSNGLVAKTSIDTKKTQKRPRGQLVVSAPKLTKLKGPKATDCEWVIKKKNTNVDALCVY